MKPCIKYRVIYHHRGKYSVASMCKFFDVSRSGYYKCIKKIDTPDKDYAVGELIKECQHKTKHTYGYRRVQIWLLKENGLIINHKTVLRIMNKYGLLSEIRRRRKYYGYCKQYHKYENVLNRDFKAEKPNYKWVTDVSYIFTKEGILYLSMIKDLYGNFIISYKIGDENSNQLVFETIKAAKKRSPMDSNCTATRGINTLRKSILT